MTPGSAAGPRRSARRLFDFYRLQARLMWEWRPTRLAILRRAILSFLGACLALAITAAVLPGLRIDGPGPLLLAGLLLLALDSSSAIALHWLLVAGRSSSPRPWALSSSSWRSSSSVGWCRETWTARRPECGRPCC